MFCSARRPRWRSTRPAAVRLLGPTMALFTAPAEAPPVPVADASAMPSAAQALPGSCTWSSIDVLNSPKPDANHHVLSVKDVSVVQANGRWHVVRATAHPAGGRSKDIGHGELIRFRNVQTTTIDSCKLLLPNQVRDPNSGGGHARLPHRLALPTRSTPHLPTTYRRHGPARAGRRPGPTQAQRSAPTACAVSQFTEVAVPPPRYPRHLAELPSTPHTRSHPCPCAGVRF